MNERTPVLVGVGIADQRVDSPGEGLEPTELMAAAVRAALVDAGLPGGRVDRIAVPRGTWRYSDPARLVARAVGADRATTVLVELGIPQQTLVNDALRSILAAELDVAVVVGGEAKHRDVSAARAGVAAPVTDDAGAAPDVHLSPTAEIVAPAEIEARFVVPVQQYAVIESALRAAEGASIDGWRDDIAALWSRFNAVAMDNPHAAFRTPRSASWLREPGPGNRPLAFPYNKWHATQWNVDQAAALVLCSAGAARSMGVPADRWVFPLVGLESSESLSLSRRRELHRWPAMRVLGEAAAAHLGRPLSSIGLVDLYSCFPVAVRVQQRELGLPLDATPTVTGGMAFAGGPFDNYVLQSTATMVEHLRAGAGDGLGLVSTVSGLLTKPGLAVWSTAPPPDDRPPLVADLPAGTDALDSVAGYTGRATIAGYTVTYDGDGKPAAVAAVADTPDGARCVAVCADTGLAERGTTEELIGLDIEVAAPAFRPA